MVTWSSADPGTPRGTGTDTDTGTDTGTGTYTDAGASTGTEANDWVQQEERVAGWVEKSEAGVLEGDGGMVQGAIGAVGWA